MLAAVAMYLLAIAFTRSRPACMVAGLVFSFSTYHIARALGHLGLATIEVLPFCAWTLIIFWRRPTWRRALLTGVGVGLVWWAAVNYVAYFLVLFLVRLAAAVMVTDWRWLVRGRNLALLGLAAGVALLVALPSLVDYPLLKQEDLAAIGAQTSNWELRIYSANLAALVLPDPYNPLLGSDFASLYTLLPGTPERSAFLGPQLYRDLASAPDDGLVLGVPRNIGNQQYSQTVSHKRLVAGVVPRLPDPTALEVENVPFYSLLEEGLTPPDSDTPPAVSSVDIYPLKPFADGLREHGISYVVLHRLSCIEPAALWPCYTLPHYEEALRFLTNTLGPPFYQSASDGITAWHVSPGNRGDDPQVSYRWGHGWIPYLGQLADGEVWRAMGTRAQLMIDSPVASQSRLHIRASGYIAPMTLAVRFNGRLLKTAWLPADTPQDLDLGPIWLEPGAGGNELSLHSRQGCVIPDDWTRAITDPVWV